MTNGTTAVPHTAGHPPADPPDIIVMRKTAGALLGPDALALAPSGDQLATLTLTLREHLAVLMPEVERAAGTLKRESIPRYCALACLGEARGKLRATPAGGPDGALRHAQRLARVLNALCDHFERVGGEHR